MRPVRPYAGFEEGDKGSIEAGKFADLVVLPVDPYAVAPAELAAI